MKNIIVQMVETGEKMEVPQRKAWQLIDSKQAIAIGVGSDAVAKQPETMEGPNVARRGRPRKGE